MFTKSTQKTTTSNSKSTITNNMNSTSTLNCYLSNVNHSLNKKKAEYISGLCQNNEIDIIFLNETGVDPNKSIYQEIKGYKIIAAAHKMHKNESKKGYSSECGGSMIYWTLKYNGTVKEPSEIIIKNKNSWFQICRARIELGSVLFIIICAYRSPSCHDKRVEIECYDKLQSIIQEQTNHYEDLFPRVEVLIAGDLNCDADWLNLRPRYHSKTETLHLLKVLENLRMRQFVTKPTHHRSTIDLLCATCPIKHHVHNQKEDLLERHHAEITAIVNFGISGDNSVFDPSAIVENKK